MSLLSVNGIREDLKTLSKKELIELVIYLEIEKNKLKNKLRKK